MVNHQNKQILKLDTKMCVMICNKSEKFKKNVQLLQLLRLEDDF